MSVERLIHSSHAAREYIGLTEFRENGKGHDRSPVFIVASTYIEQGAEGLRRISKRLNESDTINVIDEEVYRRLPIQDKNSLSLNYAAVVLGVSLIEIENMLVDISFSPSEMISRFNSAINGTVVPKWESSRENPVPLERDKWKRMIDLAEIDTSLSIMLDHDRNILPEGMNDILDQTGIVSLMQKELLQPYREQTLKLKKFIKNN